MDLWQTLLSIVEFAKCFLESWKLFQALRKPSGTTERQEVSRQWQFETRLIVKIKRD